jgi:hypothetical protein
MLTDDVTPPAAYLLDVSMKWARATVLFHM